jgi:hypothetical protein
MDPLIQRFNMESLSIKDWIRHIFSSSFILNRALNLWQTLLNLLLGHQYDLIRPVLISGSGELNICKL